MPVVTPADTARRAMNQAGILFDNVAFSADRAAEARHYGDLPQSVDEPVMHVLLRIIEPRFRDRLDAWYDVVYAA